MTSVDLIIGFLGAGKATFIKRYAGFLQAGGDLRRRLEQIMSGCCGKILRVKGCASGKDGCLYRINGTQSRITIEKAGDGRSEVNIIGMGLKRQEIKRHFAC